MYIEYNYFEEEIDQEEDLGLDVLDDIDILELPYSSSVNYLVVSDTNILNKNLFKNVPNLKTLFINGNITELSENIILRIL